MFSGFRSVCTSCRSCKTAGRARVRRRDAATSAARRTHMRLPPAAVGQTRAPGPAKRACAAGARRERRATRAARSGTRAPVVVSPQEVVQRQPQLVEHHAHVPPELKVPPQLHAVPARVRRVSARAFDEPRTRAPCAAARAICAPGRPFSAPAAPRSAPPRRRARVSAGVGTAPRRAPFRASGVARAALRALCAARVTLRRRE